MGSTYIYGTVKDSSDIILAHDSVKVYVEWWRLLSLQNEITSMLFNPIANLMMLSVQNGEGVYASYDYGESWVQRSGGINTNNDVYELTGCLNYPGTAMALVMYEGVIKTEDGGLSWQSVPYLDSRVSSLAINPNENKTAFALRRYTDYEFYKTTDIGANWNLISVINDPSGTVPNIYIDPISPQYMYIGGHKSFRTTDGGFNWSEIKFSNQGPDFQMVHIDNKRRIYVQDYNWDGTLRLRLIRSSDFGNSWSVLTEYDNNLYTYATDYESSNIIFIATTGKIMISFDDGHTWEVVEKSQYPYDESIGIALINSYPLEFIHTIGHEVWKYKKAIQ